MVEWLVNKPWIWLLIFCGGALGTAIRDGVAVWWQHRNRERARTMMFPLATFLVNVIGCLLIGIFMPIIADVEQRFFWISGILGGMTTFSTLVWECLSLIQQGKYTEMLRYFIASFGIGLVAVWCGQQVANLWISSF